MSCCTSNQGSNTSSLTGLTTVIDQLVEAKLNARLAAMESRLKELEDANTKLKTLVALAESAAQVAQDAKEHNMKIVDQCNEISRLMDEKLADGFNINGDFTVSGVTYSFKHGIIVGVA